MSIKEHPGDGTQKSIKVVVEHGNANRQAGRAGVEVVSLTVIDDFDKGTDPYNQTGRFVALALKDKEFD